MRQQITVLLPQEPQTQSELAQQLQPLLDQYSAYLLQRGLPPLTSYERATVTTFLLFLFIRDPV